MNAKTDSAFEAESVKTGDVLVINFFAGTDRRDDLFGQLGAPRLGLGRWRFQFVERGHLDSETEGKTEGNRVKRRKSALVYVSRSVKSTSASDGKR